MRVPGPVAIIVACVTLHGGGVMAQSSRVVEPSRNEAAVRSAFQAWRDGTGSPFDLLTDDASWTIVGRSAAAGRYDGRDAFLRAVIRPFNARMRVPLKPAVRHIHTDGDTVIVLFDAEGTARDGLPYVNTYAWFLEMQAGRVVSATAFFDSIAFDDLWTRVAPQ
jgi:ketosteroid isomerase-like protein